MADRIVDPGTGVSIREMAGQDGTDAAQNDTINRKFLCKGSSDPLVCRQALINQKTALNLELFANLPISSLSWRLYAGPDNWEFTATYTQLPEPGGYTVSMDTSGGTAKQTEAWQQNKYDASGELAPNYGTSINVQDGKPEGVDRIIPALKLTITARIPTEYVSDPIAYAKAVASVTGTVNNSAYLTFASGELLFLGGSGPIVGENPVLTYTFAASPNLSNTTIGPVPGINKNGHDYIWFKYKNQQNANRTIQVAEGAYVARVYTYSDFSVLKIGEPATP